MTDSCAWQDASVVALQIHGVSEPTRSTLSAEAKARGESLQEYPPWIYLIAKHVTSRTVDSLPSGPPTRWRMQPGGSIKR
jgi:hypothetical protein